MEHFVVTKEMMSKALTYMPLESKVSLAKQIAELCIKDMKTADQNIPGEQILAMPYLKYEDTALKEVLILNTLLGYYLDVEVEINDKVGYEQYDYYAGGHIYNQLERFKSDSTLRDKAFDLLSDFKVFRKMVDTEIYNIKVNNNDPVARFTSAVQILSTPENIKELVEVLKGESGEFVKKVEELKSEKKSVTKATVKTADGETAEFRTANEKTE